MSVRQPLLVGVATGFAALVAGCGGSGSSATTSSPSPALSTAAPSATSSETGTGAALFSDPLDDDRNHWGEQPPAVQFQGGKLVIHAGPGQANEGAPDVLSSRVGEFRNIVVAADVSFQAQQGQAGVTCESNSAEGYGYVFYLRSDGGALIDRYSRASDGKINEDTLTGSPVAAKGFTATGANRLTATCTQNSGGEHLALSVNGEAVTEADDSASPLTGVPGIGFEAAPNPPNTGDFVIAFDNFSVTAAAQ